MLSRGSSGTSALISRRLFINRIQIGISKMNVKKPPPKCIRYVLFRVLIEDYNNTSVFWYSPFILKTFYGCFSLQIKKTA